MSNLFLRSNDIQYRQWNVGDPSTNDFFIDDEIKLTAKLHWSGTTVTQVDLVLNNLTSVLFEICDVQKCHNPRIGDYYVMHVSKTGSSTQSTHSETGLSLNLPSGSTGKFLFKVYNDACPNAPTCDLPEGDPKTKDGTIIVSI